MITEAGEILLRRGLINREQLQQSREPRTVAAYLKVLSRPDSQMKKQP